MTLKLEIPTDIEGSLASAAQGDPEAYVMAALREKMDREAGFEALLDPAMSDISAWEPVQRRAMIVAG